MEASAITKFVRISSTKINPILLKLKNKSYIKALDILSKIPQKRGIIILKTLYSAINNLLMIDKNILKENIFITCAYSTNGPILKRVHARAKGKSAKIEKKFCHISIFVKNLNN